MFSWYQLSGVASLLRLGLSYVRPTADNHAVPLKYLSLDEKFDNPKKQYYSDCNDLNLWSKSQSSGNYVLMSSASGIGLAFKLQTSQGTADKYARLYKSLYLGDVLKFRCQINYSTRIGCLNPIVTFNAVDVSTVRFTQIAHGYSVGDTIAVTYALNSRISKGQYTITAVTTDSYDISYSNSGTINGNALVLNINQDDSEIISVIGLSRNFHTYMPNFGDGFFVRVSRMDFDSKDISGITLKNFQCVTRVGGVESVVDSEIEVLEDTIFNIEINYNKVDVQFFIWLEGDDKPITPTKTISTNILSSERSLNAGFINYKKQYSDDSANILLIGQVGWEYE